MPPPIELNVNLGLPSTPQGVPEQLFSEFNRIYNAMRSLGDYSSQLAEGIDKIVANRGSAVLIAGQAIVSNTSVAGNSMIFLTTQVLGTVTGPKPIAIVNRVAGVSFTIRSSDPTDTSSVAWWFL